MEIEQIIDELSKEASNYYEKWEGKLPDAVFVVRNGKTSSTLTFGIPADKVLEELPMFVEMVNADGAIFCCHSYTKPKLPEEKQLVVVRGEEEKVMTRVFSMNIFYKGEWIFLIAEIIEYPKPHLGEWKILDGVYPVNVISKEEMN